MQMQDLDDSALLREYVERDSEEAFASLVARHINKVYSVALRHTGNPHSAEEITQAVFVILANKARRLGKGVILSGWLYQTARLTAVTFVRSQIRRARREHEAFMQPPPNEHAGDTWTQIAPLLDTAMAGLNQTDRHAIVLRFFDGKSMKEVGADLGASEDAAKVRVGRAVEKLRRFFSKRGVVIPAAAISAAIAANSVQAAPPVLASTATALAIAKGGAASGSTLTLIKGALKLMTWTKAKTAVFIGVGVFLVAGTTTVAVNKLKAHNAYLDSWRVPGLDSMMVEQTPPQVRILPTKFVPPQYNLSATVDSQKWGGIGVTVADIVWAAYNCRPGRIYFPDGTPVERYDFISTLPQGSAVALQRELKAKLGFVGHPETRNVDVMLLKVRQPNAPGLKPPIAGNLQDWMGAGRYYCGDQPLSTETPPVQGLAKFLEVTLGRPVIDQTGLTQHFNIDLRWDPQNPKKIDAIKRAVLEQLGLELVPGHEPVELLVVENVNRR